MVEYREIPGFPDYQASTDGLILTRRKNGQNGRASCFACWRPMCPAKYRTSVNAEPYLSVVLWRDQKPHPRKVHRLILETFVGPCPLGMQCRHLNGNPSDNRLVNLAWGTPHENAADTVRLDKYRPRRGEQHRDAKLTESDVIQIRRDYRSGVGPKELARRWGVCKTSVHRIVYGVGWSHVPMPEGSPRLLRRRALDEIERDQARAWRAEGLSIKAIGDRLSVDPSSISRLLAGKVGSRSARG